MVKAFKSSCPNRQTDRQTDTHTHTHTHTHTCTNTHTEYENITFPHMQKVKIQIKTLKCYQQQIRAKIYLQFKCIISKQTSWI